MSAHVSPDFTVYVLPEPPVPPPGAEAKRIPVQRIETEQAGRDQPAQEDRLKQGQVSGHRLEERVVEGEPGHRRHHVTGGAQVFREPDLTRPRVRHRGAGRHA